MKDSQPDEDTGLVDSKYIKVNNERFSTHLVIDACGD